MKIMKLNWPVKEEAEPISISHKDRGVIVYINEDGNLAVEMTGSVNIVTGSPSGLVQITLESDK